MTQFQRKILLKRDIEYAQHHTKSAAAAARFLNVAYKTYRKYAELYGIHKTNPHGKGISQYRTRGTWALSEVFRNKHLTYNHRRLIARMIAVGIKAPECEMCNFREMRVDGQYPLKIHFRDDNRQNFELDNLQFLCLNCSFLTTGKGTGEIFKDVLPVQRRQMQDDWDDMGVSEEDMEEIRNDVMENMSDEYFKSLFKHDDLDTEAAEANDQDISLEE